MYANHKRYTSSASAPGKRMHTIDSYAPRQGCALSLKACGRPNDEFTTACDDKLGYKRDSTALPSFLGSDACAEASGCASDCPGAKKEEGGVGRVAAVRPSKDTEASPEVRFIGTTMLQLHLREECRKTWSAFSTHAAISWWCTTKTHTRR